MTSIRKIAAGLSSTTIAEAKRALKAAGMKQTLAHDVLSAKTEIDRARAAKLKAKASHRRHPTGRAPVILPSGTPAQRLEALRVREVAAAFTLAFRQPAHGNMTVVLTDDPAKVGIVQVDRDDWDVYAKSYRHGPAKCLDNTITVPASWRARVQRRGLTILDGMMTLDASPIEGSPDGVSVYAATLAAQGRGNSVNVSSGYIAAASGLSYHADSPYRALSGLKRKIASAKWEAEVRHADLDQLVGRCGDVAVRISDARAIGACEYGIKAWCCRVGIDYISGVSTVSRVYEAYQAVPAPEARSAILHAIRRSRKHVALAA